MVNCSTASFNIPFNQTKAHPTMKKESKVNTNIVHPIHLHQQGQLLLPPLLRPPALRRRDVNPFFGSETTIAVAINTGDFLL